MQNYIYVNFAVTVLIIVLLIVIARDIRRIIHQRDKDQT